MKLRLYKEDDLKEIITLFYSTVHVINIKDYTKDQVNAWAPMDIDINKWNSSLSKNYTVIAEFNNLIVGFGDLDDTGYFDRLYVHKDFQGQGIATMITLEIENYARSKNIKTLTTEASITAKPFFEKFGYEVIEEQQVYRLGQALNNFVMKKEI
ncbi:GNAT family N-acetyltransferase [Clostridium sardiniense]|uniref:GNAT family N-acetyltransferase n=1 Tax=Clostridium sardiniense TaxID=29369 RepID=UPI003D32C75C